MRLRRSSPVFYEDGYTIDDGLEELEETTGGLFEEGSDG